MLEGIGAKFNQQARNAITFLEAGHMLGDQGDS